MDAHANYIENRIREAEEKGAFRNLPGEGKPLSLTDDPVDPKLWLAHHLLKNAGLLPLWIELAKEIDLLEDKMKAIEREYADWLAIERERLTDLPLKTLQSRLPGIRAIYVRFLERYREALKTTQERKQHFNYEVPATILEKSWPPLPSRLRDFQTRARLLLTAPRIGPLAEAELVAFLDFPIDPPDLLRGPVGSFNGAGATLMAAATRSARRETLLQQISDAAAVVLMKRPGKRSVGEE